MTAPQKCFLKITHLNRAVGNACTPVPQIPAILTLPGSAHWLFHLPFPAVHTGLTQSSKSAGTPCLERYPSCGTSTALPCHSTLKLVQMPTRGLCNPREQIPFRAGRCNLPALSTASECKKRKLSQTLPPSLQILDQRCRCERRVWKALEAPSPVTSHSGVPNTTAHCLLLFCQSQN